MPHTILLLLLRDLIVHDLAIRNPSGRVDVCFDLLVDDALLELSHRMRNDIWVFDILQLLLMLAKLGLVMQVLQSLALADLGHLGIVQYLEAPIIYFITLILQLVERIVLQLIRLSLTACCLFSAEDRRPLAIAFIVKLLLILVGVLH